jgi:leader peptidase (prepilin peptidase)/N-methyltransferase
MWMITFGYIVQVAFVFAFGACVGSLINVLVYRMPLGLSVISPPSRCPSCDTRLTWRENIPVLGWLALGGKCRFCRSPISPEYPTVEAFCGVLFALVHILWFIVPPGSINGGGGEWLGVSWSSLDPEWTDNGLVRAWPVYLTMLLLLSSLVAVTLVDAKTYTIPLALVFIPTLFALVAHPAWAAWLEFGSERGLWRRTSMGQDAAPGWAMMLPGPTDWSWIGGSIGAVLGLGISCILMRLGLIRQSFTDYDEWEVQARAELEAKEGTDESPADMWIQYPHARREMLKETAFLGAPALLGMLGWLLLAGVGPGLDLGVGEGLAPLWLRVLGGVLIGYLVGGGVVWGVRIFGSLAFGKEAMGLGDVHLMAMVGACMGWVDATIAFFGAAFVALGYTLLSMAFGASARRAMPYGPFLAISTAIVLFAKPVFEWGLTRLLNADPPINLP